MNFDFRGAVRTKDGHKITYQVNDCATWRDAWDVIASVPNVICALVLVQPIRPAKETQDENPDMAA